MLNYLLRRLILLPITLFCIVLVNFVIINLAPGDPTTVTEISQDGATRKEDRSLSFGSDDRYLQFREFYGLTLPILVNTWPWISADTLHQQLWQLAYRQETPSNQQKMETKAYDKLRIQVGDEARFVMPQLLKISSDHSEDIKIRAMAVRFFVRGATKQAILGPDRSLEEQAYNQKTSHDNLHLASQALSVHDSAVDQDKKIAALHKWFTQNSLYYVFEPTLAQKAFIFLFETRFWHYMHRVFTLDFGTLRNDSNKTVVKEVVKRFKYSLTLAIIPMVITTLLCQLFGFLMAYYQNTLLDYCLNIFFLILYAVPIFVVAPFLIELALNHSFPFTQTPIPYSGFSSPDAIYNQQTSIQRLYDIVQHIFLPLVAIMYGGLAAQSRLSRTAVLEVLRQDYIRTAKAKGLSPFQILWKHVGRNASITIVTSIAGSLGIVLGGSLIVETLFEIDGFGKFFYEAVLNRDYNVIMFSTLAGSFLTLLGFIAGDIAYTILDPRVTLE